jgi:hypothetical protein
VPPIWMVSNLTPRQPCDDHLYKVATFTRFPPRRRGNPAAASVSDRTVSIRWSIRASPRVKAHGHSCAGPTRPFLAIGREPSTQSLAGKFYKSLLIIDLRNVRQS